MLKSVRIQRFKSIEDVTVPLERVTLLVGPNNAGKSSILQAIQFATSVSQSLQLDAVSRWSRDDEISGTLSAAQLVYTPLRDLNALASGGALRQDPTTAIRVEMVDDLLGSTDLAVSRGKNRNIAIRGTGQQLGERLANLEAPFSVVAPGLAGIPSFEEFRAAGIVRRAAARGDANSVFRNVLWTLRQNEAAWDRFSASLRSVFTDLDIDVEFDEDTDEYIRAYMTRGLVRLPIDSAGTGVLQAIQVLSYIGVYDPRLLILDEPDAHLHPDNQRKLARLLDELTKTSELQVLLSTHSRHFLDEFGRLEAQIHWISGGLRREGSFNSVSALLELGALDAGDRLRNGDTAVVVVTEDADTSGLQTLLLSSGLTQDDFQIWSYAGSSKLDAASVLGQFILDCAPGTKVLVHRDRDYLTDVEVARFGATLADLGLLAFVPTGTDVESHFLHLPYLAELFPELSDGELQQLLNEATVAVREKSIEILINQRVEAAARVRRAGGDPPSPGSISTQAIADFDADPPRFRHGKKTLKKVRSLLQERHGLNRNIGKTVSHALAVPAMAVLTQTEQEAPAVDAAPLP